MVTEQVPVPVSSSAPQPRSAGTAPAPRVPWRRIPIFVAAVISLLAGLWGGLLLLGLPVPTVTSTTASDHGPLMVLGFLGTVISLERAVALARPWGFLAPASAGLGGIAVLLGQALAGRLLLCVASILLVVVYVVVHRVQPAVHLRVMAAGAVCWYVATVLWLAGWTVPQLVPWLAGFLVLTIVGERLELARVGLLRPASVRQFTVASSVFLAGLVLTTLPTLAVVGTRVAGAGLLGLALWGAVNDVARRTIKIPGVTRFMAVCLLAGYVWLAVAGVLWLVIGDLGSSVAAYDAALHAVFLGFVMSMIFGHAPVIVPAVLRVRLPFHPSFYLHLGLLHVALAVRLVAGDAFGVTTLWRVGGVATEVAVVLFLVASATAVVRSRRAGGPR
ncbi:hypothetical protein N866_00390 [Actinotalea ferrariae CF5-4]|uniref:Uncharacterized protein n=1 Tax=Actinotalea ferrariae CF5-4 TaxID=948458 RepID=A0A021VVQ2_9CELL|nr:hypothetical protein [Actinotalea ferrariae]EYR65269.1 hypothetical protein N866_00390 [Actinotalea ferrariae CF5-4]